MQRLSYIYIYIYIYIKERFPRHQKEIFDLAKAKNMITTTVNCKVKVFVQSDDGSYRGVEVNSKKAVLEMRNKAIKKKPRNYASASTPCSTKPRSGNHNTLKRSRLSPGDLSTNETKNQRHEDEYVAGNNLLAG